MTALYKYNDTENRDFDCVCYNTRTMPFPIKLHWHYYGEIILLTKGNIVLQIDTEWYSMEKGDFLFVFPETVHGIFSADEQEAEFITMEFNPEKIPSLLNNTSNTNTIKHARNNNMKIHFNKETIKQYNINSIILECLNELNEKNWGYELIIKNHIHNILVMLIRLWQNSCDFNCQNITIKNTKHEFHNITEYIDIHTNENITVNDMAKLCDMSYSHFAKKFRETYGMSCKTYINKIRIMKIENLLACTNHDLNYISQETGYADCSHMIRAFKKVHNMTPNEFRKEARTIK